MEHVENGFHILPEDTTYVSYSIQFNSFLNGTPIYVMVEASNYILSLAEF